MNSRRIICLAITLCCGVLLLLGCSNGKKQNILAREDTVKKNDVQNTKNKQARKLYVVLTIDVEDKRGNVPNLIEGDLTKFGIKENCGINYIMDTFEKYHVKGVFFVNIYEHKLYDDLYMPSLLNRIYKRGHEVGLHTHPDEQLPFFENELTSYDKTGQLKIIKYGLDYIERAIGFRPVSYRSGAYRCDENIFSSLNDVGVKIDSSFFYGNSNCKYKSNMQNQVSKIDNLIEVPIIVVHSSTGRWTKLDLERLSEGDIIKTFETVKKDNGFNIVQIMFHSFSLLDQITDAKKKKLIIEGNHTIYGEHKKNKEKLNHILAFLTQSNDYEIITFQEYLKLKLPIPEKKEDSLIHLYSENHKKDKR